MNKKKKKLFFNKEIKRVEMVICCLQFLQSWGEKMIINDNFIKTFF